MKEVERKEVEEGGREEGGRDEGGRDEGGRDEGGRDGGGRDEGGRDEGGRDDKMKQDDTTTEDTRSHSYHVQVPACKQDTGHLTGHHPRRSRPTEECFCRKISHITFKVFHLLQVELQYCSSESLTDKV